MNKERLFGSWPLWAIITCLAVMGLGLIILAATADGGEVVYCYVDCPDQTGPLPEEFLQWPSVWSANLGTELVVVFRNSAGQRTRTVEAVFVAQKDCWFLLGYVFSAGKEVFAYSFDREKCGYVLLEEEPEPVKPPEPGEKTLS